MHEVVSKYIAQIRYIPTLLLYNNLFNIASTLEGGDGFDQWMAKRNPDSALLFDYEKRTGLIIDSNSIVLSTEKGDTGKDLSSPLTKYATLFLAENKIEKFNHVGVRRIGVFDTKMSYDKYIKRFYEAFFSNETGFDKIVTDSVEDTYYLLEGIKDGFSTRLKMAPLKKDQLKEHFPFDQYTPDSLTLKQETSILIDLDVYTSIENDFDSTIENLKAIEKNQQETYKNIMKTLQDRTLS